MKLRNLDHLVLTVHSIKNSCRFYRDVMGMGVERFGQGRVALRFADMKINLHQVGHEFEPKAELPTPGSADLCFITEAPLDEVIHELRTKRVAVEQGPVARNGALGPIVSVYFHDPDCNLIEVSNYG